MTQEQAIEKARAMGIDCDNLPFPLNPNWVTARGIEVGGMRWTDDRGWQWIEPPDSRIQVTCNIPLTP